LEDAIGVTATRYAEASDLHSVESLGSTRRVASLKTDAPSDDVLGLVRERSYVRDVSRGFLLVAIDEESLRAYLTVAQRRAVLVARLGV
jgi:hypothetical protein